MAALLILTAQRGGGELYNFTFTRKRTFADSWLCSHYQFNGWYSSFSY